MPDNWGAIPYIYGGSQGFNILSSLFGDPRQTRINEFMKKLQGYQATPAVSGGQIRSMDLLNELAMTQTMNKMAPTAARKFGTKSGAFTGALIREGQGDWADRMLQTRKWASQMNLQKWLDILTKRTKLKGAM